MHSSTILKQVFNHRRLYLLLALVGQIYQLIKKLPKRKEILNNLSVSYPGLGNRTLWSLKPSSLVFILSLELEMASHSAWVCCRGRGPWPQGLPKDHSTHSDAKVPSSVDGPVSDTAPLTSSQISGRRAHVGSTSFPPQALGTLCPHARSVWPLCTCRRSVGACPLASPKWWFFQNLVLRTLSFPALSCDICRGAAPLLTVAGHSLCRLRKKRGSMLRIAFAFSKARWCRPIWSLPLSWHKAPVPWS